MRSALIPSSEPAQSQRIWSGKRSRKFGSGAAAAAAEEGEEAAATLEAATARRRRRAAILVGHTAGNVQLGAAPAVVGVSLPWARLK
jgi:hypothetical protein